MGKVIAEYVWLGSSGTELLSRTHVLECGVVQVLDERPGGSELFLRPHATYPDPFRRGDHVLVLCDTATRSHAQDWASSLGSHQLRAHASNNRAPCADVMARAAASQPMFSAEQEYSLTEPCGTSGRDLSDEHLLFCLHAGLSIHGCGGTPVAGLYMYSIGACAGTELADQLWLSRYILLRLALARGLQLSFDPQLSGARCSVAFSTAETRCPGAGLSAIQTALSRLQASHLQHLLAYGKGALQTQRHDGAAGGGLAFAVGCGTTACSISIPSATLLRRGGHFVDCRPSANMDPYLVTALLVSTALQVPLLSPAAQAAGCGKPLAPALGAWGGEERGGAAGGREEEERSEGGWSSGEESGSGDSEEDMLVDELCRMDEGMARSQGGGTLYSRCGGGESEDEECQSDGTSRER